MSNPRLALVTPSAVNGTVDKVSAAQRRRYSELRSREHLLESEVEKLIKTAADSRYGFRDGVMILLAIGTVCVSASWSTALGSDRFRSRRNPCPARQGLAAIDAPTEWS